MEPQNKNLVKIYRYAYKLKRAGKTTAEIKQELIRQGLDNKSLESIIGNIDFHYIEARKKTGKKNMLYGAIWCAGGMVVTATTYNVYRGIGYYVIGCGTIIFGIGKFIRGVVQRR